MAIYHLTAKTLSRGKHSALAKADYITRSGKYAADHSEVLYMSSGNMPTWGMVDNTYWKAADEYERANGRLCKEIEFALPRELTLDQMIDLVEDFIQDVATSKDGPLPYTYSIHRGQLGENPHCHAIFSERVNDSLERRPELWFKRANSASPERGGAKKTESLKSKEWLYAVREVWAELANSHLAQAGRSERIDHRSYKDQGIDQIPTVHEGVYATKLEREGIASKRGNWNRRIREENKRRKKKAQERNQVPQDASEAQRQAADASMPLEATEARTPGKSPAPAAATKEQDSFRSPEKPSAPATGPKPQGQRQTADASMPPEATEAQTAEASQATPSLGTARPTESGGGEATQKQKTSLFGWLFRKKKKEPEPTHEESDETTTAPLKGTHEQSVTTISAIEDQQKLHEYIPDNLDEYDDEMRDYIKRFNEASKYEREYVIEEMANNFESGYTQMRRSEMYIRNGIYTEIPYTDEEEIRLSQILELAKEMVGFSPDYISPELFDRLETIKTEIDGEIMREENELLEISEQMSREAQGQMSTKSESIIPKTVKGTGQSVGPKKDRGMNR